MEEFFKKRKSLDEFIINFNWEKIGNNSCISNGVRTETMLYKSSTFPFGSDFHKNNFTLLQVEVANTCDTARGVKKADYEHFVSFFPGWMLGDIRKNFFMHDMEDKE